MRDLPAGPEVRESLDGTENLPLADLAQNLDDLATIKRWLGYDAALWHWLQALGSSALTVLDAATGGADIPIAMARRAAAAGLSWRMLGIDLHPQVAGLARERTAAWAPQVAIARGDALCLPLPDRSVDVAVCSYTLHHFAPPQARRLLAEMHRVARRGVIVVDLLRSRAFYGLAWLLLHLWGGRHRLSRRDGPRSVRRAYTLRELEQLARTAGLPQPVVARRLPFEGVLFAPGEAFLRSSTRADPAGQHQP